MILQFKNGDGLGKMLVIIEMFESINFSTAFSTYDHENFYKQLGFRLPIIRNFIHFVVVGFTLGKANHDDFILRYNLRLKLVVIEVDAKDYLLFPKHIREDLEEITRTQLIHLFGSGD